MNDGPKDNPERLIPRNITNKFKSDLSPTNPAVAKFYPPIEPPEKLYPEPTIPPETLEDGRNRMLHGIKKLNKRELIGLGTVESEWQKLRQELMGLLKQLRSLVLKAGTAGLLVNALGRLASSEANPPLGFAGVSIIEPPKISAAVDSRTAAVVAETKAMTADKKLAEASEVIVSTKPQEIVKGVPKKYFDAAMFAQNQTGIPRSVILGIFQQESSMGTNPNLSKSLDLGPAQIRPATWKTVSERTGKIIGEKPDPNNPKHAAMAAALLLKDSNFTKDGQRAIRTYHRGEGHWQDKLGKNYFEKIIGYAVPFEEALQRAGL